MEYLGKEEWSNLAEVVGEYEEQTTLMLKSILRDIEAQPQMNA